MQVFPDVKLSKMPQRSADPSGSPPRSRDPGSALALTGHRVSQPPAAVHSVHLSLSAQCLGQPISEWFRGQTRWIKGHVVAVDDVITIIIVFVPT